MARFDGKQTKQRATSMSISELSGVTQGAHEGAKVTIMKFKDPEQLLKSVYTDMLREEVTEDKVREHLEPMWQYNHALREAAKEILSDPEITDKQAALRESVAGYINSVMQLFNQPMEADNMAENNQELEQMRSDLQKAQADVKRLEALAKMNDASKAHYESLDSDEDRESFLKMSDSDRDALIKMTAVEDPTYTTLSGQTIAKSSAGAMFDVIKSQDEELRKSREQHAFAKAREEVTAEIPNMPGEPMVKTKAWQSLGDLPAEHQECIKAMLKAGEALMEKRHKPAGEPGGEELDANGKLEKLAKEYAEKNDVSIAKAHAAVLKTDQGQKLYAELEA